MTGAGLVVPVEQVVGNLVEAVGPAAKGLKSSQGLSGEAMCFLLTFLQAENGRIGGFTYLGILARGLSQFLGGLGDVENVIDDLERQSKGSPEVREGLQAGGACVGAHSSEAEGRGEKRCSLGLVNADELSLGQILALSFKIHDLATNQAPRVSGESQFCHIVPGTISLVLRSLGNDGEGLSENAVSREDRDILTKDNMGRGLASSEIVIVHAWEVVVYQRVGMNQFGRAGRRNRVFPGAAAGLGRREAEDGPEAFAPREDGMAHGAVDGGRADRGAGQKLLQGRIDRALLLPEVGL